EGEYCSIHEPTEDQNMIQALRRRDMDPEGVKDTFVHHLVGRDTANPAHPRRAAFSLRFSDLSPYAVQEILDLTEAQSERFFKANDITKLAMDKLRIWPRTSDERRMMMELDEFDTGYPQMTLNHLYDVVQLIAAIIDQDKNRDGSEPEV